MTAYRSRWKGLPRAAWALISGALVWGALPLTAQITLSVDPQAARRPISPDIYGINEYDESTANGTSRLGKFPVTVRRWGGDTSVRYNWRLDAHQTAANWFFETFPYSHPKEDPVVESQLPNGSGFDKFVAQNKKAGVKSVGTLPIIGWTTKTRTPKVCGFSVAKYGPQQKTDVWAPDCGNGTKADGKTQIISDPTDTSITVDENFAADWVRHVVETAGTASKGGVALWELDNEPVWWSAVHRDIHPESSHYDEILERGIRYAAAIKEADPEAAVGGPTSAGWESYFFSMRDMRAGWSKGPDYKYWNNPIDRRAHGDVDFIPWYLREMRLESERRGVRLLDYLDVHGYIGPGVEFGKAGDPAQDALRLRSTRVFWDPDYMPPNREDMAAMKLTPQLVRRMRQWVDEQYPGTKLALTEYNWGALNDITGAIAQADLLGIFGREGLDLATIWGPPKPEEPGRFAFQIFLDYDGQGSKFGETSIQASTSDTDQLAVFAAERSDKAITILVLNKTKDELAAPLKVAGMQSGQTVQVYRYSRNNLTAIVRAEDAATGDDGLSLTYPAYSMTLLVIPAPPASPAAINQ